MNVDLRPSSGPAVRVGDYVSALAWSADGSRLAVGSLDGTTAIVDDDGLVQHPPLHEFGVAQVAWSPTADLLATGGQDGRVRLWSASDVTVLGEVACEDVLQRSGDEEILLPQPQLAARGRAVVRVQHPGDVLVFVLEHRSARVVAAVEGVQGDLAWRRNRRGSSCPDGGTPRACRSRPTGRGIRPDARPGSPAGTCRARSGCRSPSTAVRASPWNRGNRPRAVRGLRCRGRDPAPVRPHPPSAGHGGRAAPRPPPRARAHPTSW